MEQTLTGGTNTTNNLTIETTKEIKDTFNERVNKYLRLSHQTLAEMLAIRDEEEGKTKPIEDYPLQPNNPYPPYYPYYPYVPIQTKWCPVSMNNCNNPFGDCINCPYHGGVTYNVEYTTSTANVNLDTNTGNKEQFDFMERLKKDKLI